jgi:hypothetical protein
MFRTCWTVCSDLFDQSSTAQPVLVALFLSGNALPESSTVEAPVNIESASIILQASGSSWTSQADVK